MLVRTTLFVTVSTTYAFSFLRFVSCRAMRSLALVALGATIAHCANYTQVAE